MSQEKQKQTYSCCARFFYESRNYSRNASSG